MFYLHNVTIITPDSKLDQGVILISGDTIIAAGREDEFPCPSGAESIDAGGFILVPGFIDLQINGAFGMDFSTHPESLWKVGERLTRFGVTAFLPTIVSSLPETIRQAMDVVQNGPPEGYHGARVIGLHLEGPFLNLEKPGAHNSAYLSLPDPKLYSDWSPSTGVRMVTLAPELPGALEAIQNLTRNGVLVSAGHSLANLNQAQAGFDAGIRFGTHLFNAMPPLDHHQPGLVGALLSDSRITVGLIVDGIHLHPIIVDLVWKSLGASRMNLVTDAMAALAMPAGEYKLGDLSVRVDGISARLEDGHLAGSLLSLDQALRNLMAFTGCSLREALPTLTHVPAHLLGVETFLGSLTPGSKADFVLLTPEIQIAGVWINGQQVLSITV
jgi:N-acetylglucosamine-6-phosphate deacetylase